MKLTIGSIDDLKLPVVEAHYNPKEIDLAKQTTWQDMKTIKPVRGGEAWDLEYTGAPARSMSLELLFDGYEIGRSIEPIIDALTKLASPIDETSSKYEKSRPHVCVVVWNERELPKFQCVIESLAVKYTMFTRDGKPVRATCQIKLKEIRPKRTSGISSTRTAPTRQDFDNLARAERERAFKR